MKRVQPRGLELQHSKAEDVSREGVSRLVVKTSHKVNQKTPYSELRPVYEVFAIETGSVLQSSKGQKKVSRISLNTCPETGQFCLGFSLAQTAGDGCTYYKILNELSSSASTPATVYDTARFMKFDELQVECAGVEEHKYMSSAGLVCNSGMLCGGKSKFFAAYIDMERVALQKIIAKEGGKVEYVSTNDIVTSDLGRACGSRIMILAINWRNRLDGILIILLVTTKVG